MASAIHTFPSPFQSLSAPTPSPHRFQISSLLDRQTPFYPQSDSWDVISISLNLPRSSFPVRRPEPVVADLLVLGREPCCLGGRIIGSEILERRYISDNGDADAQGASQSDDSRDHLDNILGYRTVKPTRRYIPSILVFLPIASPPPTTNPTPSSSLASP